MVTVDTPAGIVAALSRTHRLTWRDVDGGTTAESGQGDGLVTDEHGRPLELLYGFICRAGGIREVHEDDFKEALEQSLQAYRRFLADEDRPFEQSRAFPMRTLPSYVTAPTATVPSASAERPPRIPSEGPPMRVPSNNVSGTEHRRRRWMTVKAVAVLGIAAVITLLVVARLGGEGSVTRVVATADPMRGEVNCSQPVSITVHVEIYTDGMATVRWAAGPEGEEPTPQPDLTFNQADVQRRDVLVQNLRTRSGEIKGSYEVVTNAPNARRGLAEYTLQCARTSE